MGRLLLALVAFSSTIAVSSALQAARCEPKAKAEGKSCDHLNVSLDFSSCGGGKSYPAVVLKCAGDRFTARAQFDGFNYTVTGTGSSWGGSVNWSDESFAIASEKAAPARRPAQAAQIPAAPPAPTLASPQPTPSPTSTPITQTSPTPAQVAPTESPVPTPAVASAAPVEAPSAAPVAASPFAASITTFGDIRHRYESVYNQEPAANKLSHYSQNRIRARLGAKAQPVEPVKMEFRLATGPGGQSTNQSYGDTTKGMRNYDFKLDRAAFTFSPSKAVAFTGGRIARPFMIAGDNDLLFDSDLNFDGLNLGLGQTFGRVKLAFNAGEYTLSESKDAQTSKDVILDILQLGANWSATDNLTVGLILARHNYLNVKGQPAIVTGDFAGNSNAATLYSHSYDVHSVGLEVTYKWGIPISLYLEADENQSVDDENSAWIVGLKVNALKNKGDWCFSVDSRQVERDSTLGILADGDSFGGGTDGKSLRLSAGYNVNAQFGVQMTGFTGKKGISPGSIGLGRDRIQIDLNFKF